MEQKSVYLISDGGYLRKRGTLVQTIRNALVGGNETIRYVQLREQNFEAARQAGVPPASDEEVLHLADQLLPICAEHKAKLIVSRRADLVKKAGCDGVHLGASGPTLEESRSLLGPTAVVGYSAHSVETVREIAKKDYSYALLSPIFRPFSKEVSEAPLGLKPLGEACAQTRLPIFALGGISIENARGCFEAGAVGVATISAILFAPDAAVPARAFARICTAQSSL